MKWKRNEWKCEFAMHVCASSALKDVAMAVSWAVLMWNSSCVHTSVRIQACVYIYICVWAGDSEPEKKRERELARLLLLSCLSNEQTKPFVQELSANAPAWEDNIIFNREEFSLILCLSFSVYPSEFPRRPLKSCGVAWVETGEDPKVGH